KLEATVTSLLIGAFSVFFIAFFFLKEENLFTNMIVSVLPAEHENKIKDSINEITKLLTRYFGGILIQITVITIFVSFSLKIVGVQNALLIAFFAAIINVIPYVGPMIGAIFGIVLTMSTSIDLNMDFYAQTLPLLGKVVVVFALMQALDNFILQPYIFSNSVNAHPLEVFIIILVGSQLAGIPGMVLAIPTYTVFRVIGKTFLSQFRVIQSLTKSL
ncbi:MAG: AI-2E family transporter, partial [Bacteroidota bacterium]